MLKHRKDARQRLKTATREEYNDLIQAAKLTPIQERLVTLHILRTHSIVNLSLELFLSEATIRKYLAQVYDKIAKM